jgi:hypothetical protein
MAFGVVGVPVGVAHVTSLGTHGVRADAVCVVDLTASVWTRGVRVGPKTMS